MQFAPTEKWLSCRDELYSSKGKSVPRSDSTQEANLPLFLFTEYFLLTTYSNSYRTNTPAGSKASIFARRASSGVGVGGEVKIP